MACIPRRLRFEVFDLCYFPGRGDSARDLLAALDMSVAFGSIMSVFRSSRRGS